ncbi:membrane protein [Pullulanibacillus camelliae]|uniref:Membrane protein n=1 Tax=Pullulanibacillus camelliae TaxID=1707096 RepID=A0A8J2YHA3_9BACL|nr:CvpA family protein [Pullulanibacillus camelliae]GGE42280.1 membrane protein [Pullulanibacillus camelliae]
MLSLIIIILLIAGFFIGKRRGLILQLIHLTGFIAAYVIAFIYYKKFAPVLKLWIPFPDTGSNAFFSTLSHSSLEMAFYRAIAFVIIFVAVKILWQIVGSMLDFLADLPILRTVNRWLGAVFGFAEVYLVLFILLFIGALAPYMGIDQMIDHSYVAHLIIDNTPVLSDKLGNLWLQVSTTTSFIKGI